VLKEWQAGFAGIAVTLLMSALIVLDLNYGAFRCWWSGHAFTTDAVAGILVVLITALIISQILRVRRQRERSRATAAQIGVVLGQAIRTTSRDEVRTYMTMLMIAAPILIEAPAHRAFLEQAQTLGGQLVHTLNPRATTYHNATPSPAQLQQQLRELTTAAGPLLSSLSAKERAGTGSEET
jgi:hypothetical protein